MTNSVVSVVVTAGDDVPPLGAILSSLEAQTHRDWELILLDPRGRGHGFESALAEAGIEQAAATASDVAGVVATATGDVVALLIEPGDEWEPTFLADRVATLEADEDLALVWGPSGRGRPCLPESRRRFEPGEALPYWLDRLDAGPVAGTFVARRDALSASVAEGSKISARVDLTLSLPVGLAGAVAWDGRPLVTKPERAVSPCDLEGELEFARWALELVSRHDNLRCQALAARNLHVAALAAAGERPPLLRRLAASRSFGSQAGAEPYRWWLLADWLPRPLAERARRGIDAAEGTDSPAAELPELTEYRGLPVRAAGNLHQVAAELVSSLDPGPEMRGIELGAGEGALAGRLRDLGVQMEAVELEPERFRAEGIPARSVDLNGDFDRELQGPYDVVVAVELIEHLDSPRQFIARVASLLAPGGHFIVSSPNVGSWYSRMSFLRSGELHWFNPQRFHKDGHVQPVFDWQMHEFGAEAGLEVVATRYSADHLLRVARLHDGDTSGSLKGWLNRQTFTYALMRPLMHGAVEGETVVWMLRRVEDEAG